MSAIRLLAARLPWLVQIAAAIPLLIARACGPCDAVEVIRDKDVEDFPLLARYRWPTQEQMKATLVPDVASIMAGRVALESLREVIRSAVLPRDLPSRFVGLRHYLHGCDAIFVKYKVDNFLVQLVVTSAHVTLLVRDTSATERASKEQKLAFAQDVIKRFFNESEALLKMDLTLVEKGRGLKGDNPSLRDGRKRNELRSWTETIRWWTNGELAAFWVSLGPGASAAFVDKKDWFSPPQREKRQRQTIEK